MGLKERLDNSTAKPRSIKFEDGTVLLSGFPKDLANELEAYVAKFKKSSELSEGQTMAIEEVVSTEASKPMYHMPDKAFGLREKSPREYEVVVVKYNADTKDAVVDEIIPAGDFRQQGQTALKMELFKRGVL